MSRPCVVLDTNVFVAAGFNPRSASANILAAVRQGQVRMVWNQATRREIEHIIRQIPPLRARAAAGNALDALFRADDRFSAATYPHKFVAIPDPDDRKFAALAQAAGAILISSDEHLLRHTDLEDLTVLTPGAFWRRQQHAQEAKDEA